MTNHRAQKIIDAALNDPQAYERMARREADVWARTLSDPERNRLQAEDQAAAAELRVGRRRLGLAAVLRKHGLSPERGLSLGCGSGRGERSLLERGVCRTFHGIDIAAGAVEEARRVAAEQNLELTYEVQDLNFIELDAGRYDLVVAITCLHHVVRLEHIADEIARSLAPGGVLWIHDYIGETQFQFTDERLEVMNQVLSILPEKHRLLTMQKQQLVRIERREPGTLVSPFESIRSGEIVGVFKQRFEAIEQFEGTSILHRVTPPGTRASYLENDDTRTVFELLFLLDRLMVEYGVLSPVEGQYLLRKRP